MKRKTSANIRPVQLFSEEKLAEFSHMSLRVRLQWLEDANALLNKAAEHRKKRGAYEKRQRHDAG